MLEVGRAGLDARRWGRWLLSVTAVLLGAAALRFWHLDTQSIWFDEAIAPYAASHRLIDIPLTDSSNPPLYYFLLHVWMRLAGRSVFALRALPALLGVLAAASACALGRRWFGALAGWLAGLLVAASPLMWWYAQEARMYSLLALEVMWLVYWVGRLRQRPERGRAWAAALLLEAAAFFTHNLGAVVAVWLNLALGAAWLAGRRWRLLRRWLLAQAAFGVIALPWVIWHGREVTTLASSTFDAPGIDTLLAAWEALWAGSWALVGSEPAFVHAARALLGLALLGLLVALAARWRRQALLLAAHVALLLSLTLALLAWSAFAFHARYVVMLGPLALVLAAAGAAAVARLGQVGRLAAVLGVAAALALSGYALHRIDTVPDYRRDDVRGLTEYYERTLAAGDAVVVPYAYDREYALWYYGAGDAAVIELDSLDLEAVRDALNDVLSGAARVELMDWFKAFGDRRGAVACLLEDGGRRLGEPFRVVELGTQGYEVETPLALPSPQPVAGDFGAVQLEGAAYAVERPADRSRCVTLDWRLAEPVPYDLAVALTVTNALGWEITHVDASLLREDFAPASLWGAGERAQSFAVLRLPAGTPPGVYPLRARVYDTGTLAALDLRIDGAPAGKDVTLGEIVVTAPERPQAAAEDDMPFAAGAALGDGGWVLDAYDAPAGPVSGGETLRVTLRWRAGEGDASPLLRLAGEGWQVEAAGEVAGEPGALVLDWREVAVPADAPAGAAVLSVTLGGGVFDLARLDVQATDRLLSAPPFEYPLGAAFEGVGVLAGFSLETDQITAGEPLPLVLVWRATGTPDAAYTVFTHLLSADGRVIAQHDAAPAGGARPTTGWLPPEYVVDAHALVFNEAGAGYTGPARIEVGLYDPATGARVAVGGGDYVILPVEISVLE
jgi:hypothetical protein